MNEEKPYDISADWWCFGVLMYEMICGKPPFVLNSEDNIFDAILHNQISYPTWVSLQTRSLLQQLLVKDPSKRFVNQIQQYLINYCICTVTMPVG